MRATAALAALLALLAACAGGASAPQRPPEDPATLVEQALAAMDGLRSLRLEMRFDSVSPPYVIEFQEPDSYRVQLQATDGGEPSTDGFAEAVYFGDRSYARQCAAPGERCSEWEEGERPAVAIAGPSPSFLPDWPLVALEMAGELESPAIEQPDGESLAHVSGTVNHLRAIFENQRRAFTAAGITTFSTECESGSGGQQECRDLGYEETLEQQEHLLRYYDVQPAKLDVWISSGDLLVHRIRLNIPPHDDPYAAARDSGEAVVTIDYSLFNDVTVEAP